MTGESPERWTYKTYSEAEMSFKLISHLLAQYFSRSYIFMEISRIVISLTHLGDGSVLDRS